MTGIRHGGVDVVEHLFILASGRSGLCDRLFENILDWEGSSHS